VRGYFRLVHRVTVVGLEGLRLPAEGKLILIANHGSLLDGPLLWAFLPFRFRALVEKEIAEKPVLRTLLTGRYVIKVSTLQSYSLKHVIEAADDNVPLLIFPEGRRSTTGSLMKIYEGAGFIALKTHASVLPVHIEGNYVVPTSRAPGRKKLFGRLTVVIGQVQPPLALAQLSPREQRRRAAGIFYRHLSEMRYAASFRKRTLPAEFIHLCRVHRRQTAFKDVTQHATTYGEALAGAFLLGRRLRVYAGENIGVLLPNLTVTALLFFGLLLYRKVPAFLNYAAGTHSLAHMMALAGIETVVTSREFLRQVNLDEGLFSGRTVVFLEDIELTLRLQTKFAAFWKSRFPGRYYAALRDEERKTAVILFTSGSEGLPKGVPLTHANLIANVRQCLARIDVYESDYLLNALPLFHSFGLTVGTLLALFVGAKTFLYVSPLHYRMVPEAAYRENCTILIGTNIFLNGYARKANAYDFYRMRYVYCGAEALQDRVFETYAKKFGIRVLSGYGATECGPVISMNNAIEHEYGTVGKLLPGMEYQVMPVEGLGDVVGRAGLLQVKGENVMPGYLGRADTGITADGWYDTGDIVSVNGRGFITIIGRVKRFAKVSGEMVSLTAIEEALAGVFGVRREAAVIAEPDARRGERIELIANDPRITLKDARSTLAVKGFSELAQPRHIRYVSAIPKLATGKTDYVRLNDMLKREREEADLVKQ
jgi:acyl-[acyl-carrier-protein]-phospholipid O-acyltransferase/long-chain-fatty-acid--[acyl-carrier-protein] ligase